jgi:hypothetical protein
MSAKKMGFMAKKVVIFFISILSLVKCKLNIKLNEQGIGKRYSGSGPQK